MDDERVIKILNYFLNCILNSVATSKNQQNHGLFAKAKKKKNRRTLRRSVPCLRTHTELVKHSKKNLKIHIILSDRPRKLMETKKEGVYRREIGEEDKRKRKKKKTPRSSPYESTIPDVVCTRPWRTKPSPKPNLFL